MKFIIDMKVKSWNAIACKHWRVYKAAADEAKMATFVAIKEQKVKPILSFPIKIHFHAAWSGNKRHDVDALYCKAVLDQMVTDKLIPDDSLDFISHVLYTGETKAKKDCLIVEIITP